MKFNGGSTWPHLKNNTLMTNPTTHLLAWDGHCVHCGAAAEPPKKLPFLTLAYVGVYTTILGQHTYFTGEHDSNPLCAPDAEVEL